MKKLWNDGHLDVVKGDTFSYLFLIYFLFLFTSPLRCSFFSAFLATAAAISMQSRGRGWWMVSGMKPGVQDYCNLFRYDTKASSLGNHLVIQYSLLFRTSCLHLPLHIPQYYSNISSNERLLKEEHNFDLWVCFLILFDLIAPTSPFLHWWLFTLYYLDLNIYMHRRTLGTSKLLSLQSKNQSVKASWE